MPPSFTDVEHSAADVLIGLALAEDLREAGDLTSGALIREDVQAEVNVVARQAGVLSGTLVGKAVYAQLDDEVCWSALVSDGTHVEPGTVVASVTGPLRSVLTGERTALNFFTHLSGIATLTDQFVDSIAGTDAVILDTRKTLPGYRVLQKYAVRCGGGTNHRMGLFDGCLIKDNHLAAWTARETGQGIADAVRHAQRQVPAGVPVEVEVDTLEQLSDVLEARPDVVLLDNMGPATLREAIALRNQRAPGVQLEASGGISLDNVGAIAETGVERISIGALTHSAAALDLAFDWKRRI